MKPILVHCHIYYTEMWPELRQCIQNIAPYPFDLYVTMVEEHKETMGDILNFKPDAHIDIVPNKGFDIASFIDVLNKVDLDAYDYIVKLHTKRNMPLGTLLSKFDVSGHKWRKYLLEFLSTPEIFKKSIEAFEQDQKLGTIADFHTICCTKKPNPEAADKSFELMKLLNLNINEYKYVAGTMFIARSELFKQIKKLHLSFNDFDPSERGVYVLPYGLEILFGLIISAQGYKVRDTLHCKIYQFFAKIYANISSFVWRKKECSNGKVIIKFCKIPLPKKLTN